MRCRSATNWSRPARLTSAGKGVPARGEIYIDKKLVGAVEMPHTVPNLFSTEGLTCGHDGGSRVAPDDYTDDFPFTGALERVTIDLSGDLIIDSQTDIKVAMARQWSAGLRGWEAR